MPVFKVRRALGARLNDAGIEDAELDARHMLRAVFGDVALDAGPDHCLDKEAAMQLETMCARREKREPLSHILGSWEFWSLELRVSVDVLTPRPETERLIELALGALGSGPSKILDLGTGSGAILYSLLSERPEALGVGVDLCPDALKIADANARALNLNKRIQLIEGNWGAALDLAPFDVLVSNPPYIASAVINTLEPEVRAFEPMLALDGGADGLDAYRAILPLIPCYLKSGGWFAFEIGADQGEALLNLAQTQENIQKIEIFQDLVGRDRVICGYSN
ncbi:MAG: protein-(glutamine-N5) methyltransferase, release factor-specific [Robiginitomaculum sp.]|nr:MAG: protein-(glutamine-N5) methyltransferase, release factor-specific [Robiginitomaculum sp.]